MTTPTPVPSAARRWSSRIIIALISLFLLADGIAKLFKPVPVLEGTLRLGYPESAIIPLGIVLTLCTILYLIPRTAILGVILLTGYLGGAVATHVRVGDPWYFPIIIGALAWGGLWLRDDRLRTLLPVITESPKLQQ